MPEPNIPNQNLITIPNSESRYFCPQDRDRSYFVQAGAVLVYLVPWQKGKPGKRVFLLEISETDKKRTIPALVYEDADYRRWRILIEPKTDSAVLRVNEFCTEILKQNFLLRLGIDTYRQEGFDQSLVEHYNRVLVKEHAFIGGGAKADQKARSQTYDVIKDTFSDHEVPTTTGTAAYQALIFVCSRLRVPLIRQEELLKRCGKNPDIPTIAKASRLICRKVVLEADWQSSDCGCLISTIGQELVACVPAGQGKYRIYRTSDNSVRELTGELAQQVSPQAWFIGRTLPAKKLSTRDIIAFCKGSITARDLVPSMILALVCALIGVLLPTLNRMIYDDYIPLGSFGNLAQMCLVILTFMTGNIAFSIVKNLFDFRLTSRLGNDLQSAVYHRLFHLPESFFRTYDSADLGQRVLGIGASAASVAHTVLVTGIAALFSIVYLIRMISYSGKLSWIGFGMYLIYVLLILWITAMARSRESVIAQAGADASSRLYQYLEGVDKIRMAGVEDRAMLSYMQPYAKQQSEQIKMNRWLSARQMLAGVVSSIFSMVFYYVIVKKNIGLSIGSFIAFNTAFGSFTSALATLVDESLTLFRQRDLFKRFMPVFEAVPEDDDNKELPGELTGSIALEHVSFAYEVGGRNVLNNLSLRIAPGEYVGIVGASGCGKSTLLKLLLGFETPQSGVVLVDGKDLSALSKNAYRRQLGVVLQNGRLISGSIYENITITAPDATLKRVEEVVDQVSLREDIKAMPMGLHTMLNESSNTISGGQQQRILIARAIVGKPKILIFDEATSALDNLTQAAVSSSLDKMNITRIVVAHRLSTIKNCDRILVMKDGNIVEEGNYTELMARRGLFYELASRQIAE